MKTLVSFTKFLFLLILIFEISIKARAQTVNYAPLPYYTGFEDGVLDVYWNTSSSLATGRILVWPSDTLIWGGDTAKAKTGDKFLGMDVSTGGVLNLNQVTLRVNASGASGLYLSFWWSDWNDETSVEDGIYISNDDGINYFKVLDLAGASNTDLNWVYYHLNLDSINAVYNMNYTSTYTIKFQQYDDYYLAGGNDGFMFDDVSVSSTLTSIQNKTHQMVKIFPNPTKNIINIAGLNEFVKTTINIKNNLGQIIFTENFIGSSTVQLKNRPEAGVYFIELLDQNRTIIKEFIQQ